MSKRENRLKPIEHEMRQITNLKALTPNATPMEALLLSDALVDIAIAALEEVHALESGQRPELKRLRRLVELVDSLPTLASKGGMEGSAFQSTP
jgi:hypothetical protein